MRMQWLPGGRSSIKEQRGRLTSHVHPKGFKCVCRFFAPCLLFCRAEVLFAIVQQARPGDSSADGTSGSAAECNDTEVISVLAAGKQATEYPCGKSSVAASSLTGNSYLLHNIPSLLPGRIQNAQIAFGNRVKNPSRIRFCLLIVGGSRGPILVSSSQLTCRPYTRDSSAAADTVGELSDTDPLTF